MEIQNESTGGGNVPTNCEYLEPGWPPKCNHPRVQNDDELFPNRRENIVKYVCLGKRELCVFKMRDKE